MISTNFPKDILRSTPLQRCHGSRYVHYDEFGCRIDISPIRKAPYQVTDANLGESYASPTGFNKVNRVIWKLPFKTLFYSKKKVYPMQIDSGIESMNKTFDSSLESNGNSSNFENQSLSYELRSFPEDLNCDTENKYAYCINNKEFQPHEYISQEHFNQQLLDKNNNVAYISQQQRASHSIDILYELSIRGCAFLISNIVSHLSDEDLRNATNVSKSWKHIILSDDKANKRRTEYINNKKNIKRGPNKENGFQAKSPTGRSHKSVFLNIMNGCNNLSQMPLFNDNFVGRFDSFCEAANTLKHKDNLMKCPKCNYPAQIVQGNKYCCTRNLCQHEFCKKCTGPFLDNHCCSEPKFDPTSPHVIIGSKLSKKYLRRL